MKETFHTYFQNSPRFSGSVVVAQDGEKVFSGSFGLADREQGIPNTSQTKFYVGSITKCLTALSVSRLVQEGKLSFQLPINDFLPDFYPEARITLHQLLSHTSGVPNHLMDKSIQLNRNYSPEHIMEMTKRQALLFVPGRKWSYSNTNYLLLALVIERVTGERYHQYLQKHIFQPADMKESGFAEDDFGGVALGYHNGKKDILAHSSLTLGSGDLISTAEDLFRFEKALSAGKLLDRLFLNQMEAVAHDGKFIKYGYGWFIHRHFHQKSLSHGGLYPMGYTSVLDRYPEKKVTIIVLSNDIVKFKPTSVSYFGSAFIARELAALIFGQKLKFWQKIF